MTITYNQFKNNVLGKAFDLDGAYGAQCWDGAKKYAQDLGHDLPNCTSSGYVKDIWNNRKTNGILNWTNEVTVMQAGDIAVFKEVPNWTPYSHIAIFDSDIDGTYGYFLGQNQGGANGTFSICKLPYSATFDTAFRPKEFANQNTTSTNTTSSNTSTVLNSKPSDFVAENGTFYPNTTIKIRKAPSTKGADTGLVYESGMSVNYDGYVKREGYVWISWIGSSKTRRWMAAGELNSAGVNANPYGTFK